MRSHGKAVQAYRALGRHQIGLVGQHRAQVPGVATARGRSRAPRARADAYMNRQYLDPALLGQYPDETARDLRRGLAAMAGRRHAR